MTYIGLFIFGKFEDIYRFGKAEAVTSSKPTARISPDITLGAVAISTGLRIASYPQVTNHEKSWMFVTIKCNHWELSPKNL